MLLNRTLDIYISCWKVCVDQTASFELGEPCALNHWTLFVKYAPMVPLFRSSPKRFTKWPKCMICGFGCFWLNSTPWNTPQAFHELISSLWFLENPSLELGWWSPMTKTHFRSGIPQWALLRREKQSNMLTLYGNQRFEDGILWWTVSTKIKRQPFRIIWHPETGTHVLSLNMAHV